MSRKMIVLLVLAGGLLFNLDRIAVGTGVAAWLYKALPRSLTSWMPGAPPVLEGIGTPKTVLRGTIASVYDGDTATLLTPDGGTRYKLRFYGIDAPEAAQDYGQSSRDALAGMILTREVEAEVVSVDRYGRSVARVRIGDLDINLWMVLQGNAWWYSDFAPDEDEYEAAETEARAMRRGLWQNQKPIPPWEYRQTHLEK